MISREFLDSVRCTEDIVYKTSGGHRLLLDLYGPARLMRRVKTPLGSAL